MKEKPILFSAPMIKAILDDRKTQTRRTVALREFAPSTTRGYDWTFRDRRAMWNDVSHARALQLCPHGALGDRLWVRETWCLASDEAAYDELRAETWRPRGPKTYGDSDVHHVAFYRATDNDVINVADEERSPWKPSIFMPRWASRITLEITEVRVQRLQEISEDDARAEGVEPYTPPHGHISPDQRVPGPGFDRCRLGDQPHRLPFADLWDRINGKRCPWSSNPWVWALTFRRLS